MHDSLAIFSRLKSKEMFLRIINEFFLSIVYSNYGSLAKNGDLQMIHVVKIEIEATTL